MAHTKQFSYLHILAIIILMMMLRLSTNMWRHHFIHYLFAIHYIYIQYITLQHILDLMCISRGAA